MRAFIIICPMKDRDDLEIKKKLEVEFERHAGDISLRQVINEIDGIRYMDIIQIMNLPQSILQGEISIMCSMYMIAETHFFCNELRKKFMEEKDTQKQVKIIESSQKSLKQMQESIDRSKILDFAGDADAWIYIRDIITKKMPADFLFDEEERWESLDREIRRVAGK